MDDLLGHGVKGDWMWKGQIGFLTDRVETGNQFRLRECDTPPT
jgi:hypothetical protein